MPEYDLILRGGTIVDGTKTPRYISDIAVKDGKIAKISGLKGSSAARELDASGLIVAPGFVDLHTHYDAQIQWDPYCTLSGWHGVTSVAIGNCGFGLAPCHEKDRERAMLSLTRTEAIPINAMKAGRIVGLGELPRVSGNAGTYTKRSERDYGCSSNTPVWLGDGMGGGQEEAPDRG